jgi:hypothetical protein
MAGLVIWDVDVIPFPESKWINFRIRDDKMSAVTKWDAKKNEWVLTNMYDDGEKYDLNQDIFEELLPEAVKDLPEVEFMAFTETEALPIVELNEENHLKFIFERNDQAEWTLKHIEDEECRSVLVNRHIDLMIQTCIMPRIETEYQKEQEREIEILDKMINDMFY